jgi:hypothetical protein
MQESLREYVAAYNTLVSLEKTMGSMKSSGGDLASTEVQIVDNSVDTISAFELQSQQFQKAQNDFEEYMERLKEDIDRKAEKFGYVEYYDAKLRDGYSNEVAVATSEIHALDERRKSLATVNPLFAKTSMLPPEPSVEDITYEQISINLPAVAQSALDELSNVSAPVAEEPAEETVENDVEQTSINDEESFNEEVIDEEATNEEFEEDEAENEIDEDEQIDEDEDEIDDEVSNDGISASDFDDMSDDDIMGIMDSMGLDYDPEDFDRDAAIETIIENNN